MSFSYEPELDNDVYRVRFLLQDTDESTRELEDEEIQYLLGSYGSVGSAALAAARSLYGKYSRQVSRAVGDLRISLSDKANNWKIFMEQLEESSFVLGGSKPYVGGLSEAEEREDAIDRDLVQPGFWREMHDYPSTLNVPDERSEL